MKKHDDAKMDKPVVAAAVHKHEANMHPSKPKTKLATGGMVARGVGAARPQKFTRNG